MADHISEEEQIAAIKQWWSDNKFLVITPIVSVVVGYGGWQLWKGEQAKQIDLSASAYQSLVEVIGKAGDEPLSEAQRSQALTHVENVLTVAEGSRYEDLAQLTLARIEAEQLNWDKAQAALQSVIDSTDSDAMKATASVRLARVLVEQSKLDAALNAVIYTPPTAFDSVFSEMRGDVYSAQGNVEAAFTAYQQAVDKLPAEQFQRKMLLEMKLNNAKVIPSVTESEASQPKAQEGDA